MGLRNTTSRWGIVAQSLHWIIVALVITQIVLARIGHGLPLGMEKLAVLARHKSVGITILGLVVIRLLWRWMNPTPLLPDTLKPYERVLAKFTHAAALPVAVRDADHRLDHVVGAQFSSELVRLVQLPDFVAPNRPLYDAMHETHEILALMLVLTALLHIAAALKHHFVLKDDVLRRMLPFTRTPP